MSDSSLRCLRLTNRSASGGIIYRETVYEDVLRDRLP